MRIITWERCHLSIAGFREARPWAVVHGDPAKAGMALSDVPQCKFELYPVAGDLGNPNVSEDLDLDSSGEVSSSGRWVLAVPIDISSSRCPMNMG